MKFALNGALTIGTWDGANIEMAQAMGEDNMFVFGLRADAVARMRALGYDPRLHVEENPALRRVLDAIAGGAFSPRRASAATARWSTACSARTTTCCWPTSTAYLAAQARRRRAVRATRRRGPSARCCNIAGDGRVLDRPHDRRIRRTVWSVPAGAEPVSAVLGRRTP